MPQDISNNHINSNKNKLGNIKLYNKDSSNNLCLVTNHLDRFLKSKITNKHKLNRNIKHIIDGIKKDIANINSYNLGKTPLYSKQILENRNKRCLDISKANKNVIIKNTNDKINRSNDETKSHYKPPCRMGTEPHNKPPSRMGTEPHNKPLRRMGTEPHNKPLRRMGTEPYDKDKSNTIKHLNKNIDMKIQDLIQKIKLERQYLENTKNHNKHYVNLSRDLDVITNTDKSKNDTKRVDKSTSTEFSHKNLIVTHRNPLPRRRIDSLTNRIDQTYFHKYNNPLFHGNSIFDNKENIPFFLNDKTNQLLRPNSLPKIPNSLPCVEKKKVNIEVEIESLDDLLKLIEDYPIQYDIEYNINMEAMHNIKDPLLELKRMIGMNKLKDSIVDQIIYFIQDLHQSKKLDGDFMHTCIYGPPGTGKTEVAKIMGKIYSKLGILKKNVFKKVTRSDLIAGYLGQTTLKTRDIIKSCLGGVMFIDEAYALGNSEKRDSFAKECIDTLCEALSDHKHDLMVIIAGYEDEMKKCFFSYNQGLDSRFTWRFKTDDYNSAELRQIFIKKVHEAEWTIDKDSVQEHWFEQHKEYFKFFGRDMETLFSKVKIAHSRRVFCLPKDKKKKINDKDLEKGFMCYLDNDEVKRRKDDILCQTMHSMYS